MNKNLVKYLYVDDDENINVYVVGDIHGCYTQLMSKLKEIKFNFNTDLLICVGDLVDRGKENEKVFNLLREHWFISIKGNHEHFCQEGFLNDHVAYSHKAPNNGGSWFYKLNEDIQEHIVNRFKSLPVLLEVHYQNKKFGFVHADVPNLDWEELKKEVTKNYKYHGRLVTDLCMWTRDTVYKDTVDVKNIHRVFLGHTVLEEIKHVGNCTFLDTGVVFGGKLSIVNLKDYC